MLLAAYKVKLPALSSTVIAAAHQPSSKKGKYKLADVLGDAQLANSLRTQAQRMMSEAKGLMAEAERLNKEADSLNPVKSDTKKVKKTKSKVEA